MDPNQVAAAGLDCQNARSSTLQVAVPLGDEEEKARVVRVVIINLLFRY